jgi:adenosylcobinamide-GDP ribazoletransferase
MDFFKDFFTGLQFLTRIRIVRETEWSAERFGRSVKFFPVVGLIIGLILYGFDKIAAGYLPHHIVIACILLLMILLTGGLTCDGFMDTMDGVFSGRSRDRMLEIMKDSRVGANGVMAFVLLVLLKWSLLLDMPGPLLPLALLATPVLGKFSMVLAITLFPYARPDGIGKAFACYAGKYALWFAVLCTGSILFFIGKQAILCWPVATLSSLWLCRYLAKVLGGLTGDTYGAINELCEIVVLLAFYVTRI